MYREKMYFLLQDGFQQSLHIFHIDQKLKKMYQCGICLKGPNGEMLEIKKYIAQKPQT